MDTLAAYTMGMASRGNELMVFDWDKAARIIKEKKPEWAGAGLRNDWEYTGGTIYEDGEIIKDEYTYLASTWATPEINIDGQLEPCFLMQSETPGWDEGTKWPDSAQQILFGECD